MGDARFRQRKPLDAGIFQPEIDSFRLHLAAEGLSPKTVRTYIEAAQWFAAAHLRTETSFEGWEQVRARDVQRWMVRLLDQYSDSYASNQYRALQQFFRWFAAEEEAPDPFARLKPPKVGEKLIPVFTDEELARLARTCEGRGFAQRRDAAILAVFQATGLRLSELAGIRYIPDGRELNDLDLMRREIRVRGKGGKERVVKISYMAARSLDRYLRLRMEHAQARRRELWLGVNNRPPLTANGIYQMIKRRGVQCGVLVHPHKFRHHFSHTWLYNGGAEGDLMELNGWTSPQMLHRYGASARSTRARRTYDRVMDDRPS